MSATQPPTSVCQIGETDYTVDGFRSLNGFNLRLSPGLNVLVGSNGAGKTNFVEFLDFLGVLITSGAVSAVSHAGGISRVFSQEFSKRASPQLSAAIEGFAEPPAVQLPTHNPVFRFRYEIEIKFSKRTSTLFISKESLKFFKLCHTSADLRMANTSVGAMSVTRRSPGDDIEPKWKVGPRLLSNNHRNPLAHVGRISNARALDALRSEEAMQLAPDESFLASRQRLPALDAVRLAIIRSRTFNIVPEHVRLPDDITRPPGISRDGSGLTATLFHLQSLGKGSRATIRMRYASAESFVEITDWTKLVFRELQSISVNQDPHSGKYLGYFSVGQSPSLRIPFQSASDGTLKWLSLVTYILTGAGIVSLEEPENFLHPKMQQFLVSIIRDALPDHSRSSCAILTTHSETLINQCKASELVIFEFDGKRTTCRKISNPERVQSEINKTGFGLGYYYANNSLS